MTDFSAKPKTPSRMCVVCRETHEKTFFLRIVRSPLGEYCIDLTNKASGRGAYICRRKECIEKCVRKKLLNKAFKCSVDQSIYDALAEQYGAE